MKLLIDQNISFRIIRLLANRFPNAQGVRELGLENSTDIEIWDYAGRNNFTIVTFDSDFYDFATYYGSPPKVIQLKVGNSSTKELSKIMIEKADIIRDFIQDESYSDIACITIS